VKAQTISRVYYTMTAALVATWFVNLSVVLHRPTATWLDAASPPLLSTIAIWLALVTRARNRNKAIGAEGRVERTGISRYVVAALAAAAAVVAFAVGFRAYR
jgi:hypothetical protein